MIEDQKLEQVQNYVSQRSGQRLAGERELAELFEISRPRLRAILDVLETEGSIQRRQGSGTYALVKDSNKLRRVLIFLDAGFKLGDDPFVSRLVEHLQNEIQAVGAQCLMQRASGQEEPLRGCDGIIAMGANSLKSAYYSVAGVPPTVGLIAPRSTLHSRTLSLLEMDDEDAGRQSARRLLEAKVERILFYGRQSLSAAQERLQGAKLELVNQNISLQSVECGLNYASGFQQGLNFSAESSAKTGIIAANDWLALGLHTGLQSAHPELRDRIKIVSFDGLPLTSQPQLDIESLAIPIETIAVDAIAELQRLKGPRSLGRTIRYALEWSPN